MEVNSVGLRYLTIMGLLILSALLLAGRLGYLYLADAERFPITTIKVAATYEHITHKELENVLAKYLDASFFLLSVKGLQNELNSMSWIDTAYVERVWPDTLKIKLTEKKPVAIWGDALMTRDGKLFNQGSVPSDLDIPKLKGPQSQQLEVLQVYEKLSKILSSYGLNASGLYLRDNQSWVLLLNHSVKIYLGKKELEERLLRFCKAYPAVFAEKADQLAGVDLRYPRGMAVQWKQQMGR
ncbi:TPA: FtsQ-type POTRA domain-containing protein [Legionella pneumophila]|uniref:cell division protein FtsQ/DivIB n=1 Tax=Legionella pneumophila TaxID=446 RepID=UPI000770A161|nr:cell division protein FtsQ/DivIB [Legionella pneumophila]HAT9214026.1 FtsQ-type POTRA domain-containing protein [Legionella pneumophila subsp. pneumophila]CZI68487.1 Cell division protein FtsQ [Legionella pneumophila]HAT9261332.1 FtsQ-type POTRA domain-containing protein [Legionella pneumophila subsp. pneumophila]HAT9281984.1 FtsQ-type POTRA domain-containing protein [Legionella pneumophila subsp. pneumophila]HAT9287760.1 FtsQ-type POTRA domain-containing protein [Legionella pneumophila sub